MADLNVDYYDLYQFSDKFFEVCRDLKETQSKVKLTYVKVNFASPIELCGKAGRSLSDVAHILEDDERILTNLYPADYEPSFLPFNTPLDVYAQDWNDWLDNHELGHAIYKFLGPVRGVVKAAKDLVEKGPLGAPKAVLDLIMGIDDMFDGFVDIIDVLAGNGFQDHDIFREIDTWKASMLNQIQDDLGLDYKIDFVGIVNMEYDGWDHICEICDPIGTGLQHLRKFRDFM